MDCNWEEDEKKKTKRRNVERRITGIVSDYRDFLKNNPEIKKEMGRK